MNRIYLVRHAESVANTQGVYQGQTYDTGLSPLGYRQAIRLAGYLKGHPLDKIITSPLKRTAITAHLVSAKTNTPVTYDSRIIETNHGVWEGVTKKEIASHWPDIYSAWQTTPSSVNFPDGESYPDTQSRVLAWWRQISGSEGNFIVITHDNVIRIILTYLTGTDPDRIWEFDLHPASITVIEDGLIRHLNQVSHLQDLMADLSVHAL